MPDHGRLGPATRASARATSPSRFEPERRRRRISCKAPASVPARPCRWPQGDAHDSPLGDEAVRLIAEMQPRHPPAGIDELLRIGLAFRAQRIVPRRQHQGGRESLEVGGPQRRGAPIVPLLPRSAYCSTNHAMVRSLKGRVLHPRQHVGAILRIEIGGRIDQQLEHERRQLPSRDMCAITAARLPPALSPPPPACRGRCRALRHGRRSTGWRPRSRRRRQETVLGPHAVVDRHDGAAGRVGDLPAQPVVGLEIADHPAAAVEEHQARAAPCRPPCRRRGRAAAECRRPARTP